MSFAFHANAYGFGGRITAPFDKLIPVQASTVLPQTGGFGSDCVENFNFENIFRFDSARVMVSGVFVHKPGQEPHYSTMAQSVIEGLNILNIVTVDRIVSQITTKHEEFPGEEAEITPFGTQIQGLRVGGIEIPVKLNLDFFSEHSTYSSFEQVHPDRERSRWANISDNVPKYIQDAFGHHFKNSKEEPRRRRPGSLIHSSVVEPIHIEDSKFVKAYGHILEIKEFGKVILGEIFVGPDLKRINMIRLELGCPTSAQGSGSGAEGNGSHTDSKTP